MKYFLVFSLLFLFSACFEFEELEFKGVENFKIEKMEGKAIDLKVDLKIENPNKFNISVKPSKLELYAEDELLGETQLTKKIKLIKKKEKTYTLPIHLDLEDGAMMKIMKYALKKSVKIRFKGKVKGAVMGISKKVAIDETKTIEGNQFNLFNKQ